MTAQSGEFLPRLAAVLRAEQRGVFHSCVDGVRIAEGRFQMPDSLQLPRMLFPVVKLMSRWGLSGFRGGMVPKLVALALLPSLWLAPFPRLSPPLSPTFAAIIAP